MNGDENQNRSQPFDRFLSLRSCYVKTMMKFVESEVKERIVR